ncbi:hypothetical protein CJ030_MR0G006220 [Morella rubra]|uniref:Senescence regulator S40 n=1 Tax=Morella rubra TaxID=262757 RepID=A0A6A1UKL7_9ROSI|nr:hypothetical protein CJ030_MR0G006220 [Morella rubra]
MDLDGPTRFRPRKSIPSDRFLGPFPQSLQENSSSSDAPSSNAGVELNEDDVLWTGDFTEPDQRHSTPSSSVARIPGLHRRYHHNQQLNHHQHKNFAQSEGFGILAALPENETSLSPRKVSHVYQKGSFSPSSSSSSRMIPVIPKPPQDRMSLPSSVKYQSAPVNVPVMPKAVRSHREFDDIEDADDPGDGEMLPPHEIVARTHSPMVAFSVLEGAGRTLKGRDLRQVRNAVWRRTGFLD